MMRINGKYTQGKRGLFDLSKMSAFGPLVIAVSQENAHSLRGISRFLSDSVQQFAGPKAGARKLRAR